MNILKKLINKGKPGGKCVIYCKGRPSKMLLNSPVSINDCAAEIYIIESGEMPIKNRVLNSNAAKARMGMIAR